MQPFIGIARSKARPNERATSRPWQARVNAAGQSFYLGCFADPEDAARAFDNAAFWLAQHGYEYERLNFPKEYAGDNVQPRTPKTEQVLAIYQMRVAAGTAKSRTNTSAKFQTKVRKFVRTLDDLQLFISNLRQKLATDFGELVTPQQVTGDKPSVTIEIPARFQTPPGVALAAYPKVFPHNMGETVVSNETPKVSPETDKP